METMDAEREGSKVREGARVFADASTLQEAIDDLLRSRLDADQIPRKSPILLLS